MFKIGQCNSLEFPAPLPEVTRKLIHSKASALGLRCTVRQGHVRVFKGVDFASHVASAGSCGGGGGRRSASFGASTGFARPNSGRSGSFGASGFGASRVGSLGPGLTGTGSCSRRSSSFSSSSMGRCGVFGRHTAPRTPIGGGNGGMCARSVLREPKGPSIGSGRGFIAVERRGFDAGPGAQPLATSQLAVSGDDGR